MKLFLILGLTVLHAHTALSASVERIEPPFWWAGMHHPGLQLMFYGEDIGALKPAISYPGVTVERVIRVDNDNYLFVDLFLDSEVQPGKFEIALRDGEDVVSTHSYQLLERNPGSSMREGFNTSDVIYLITPDRFANGDPDNDQVAGMQDSLNRSHPYGRHGGDIQGIIDHLDYIQDLGFTAVWLNPVLENNQGRASYHGYATTDYYQIDPRFGSNADYVRLDNELERRGMKLVMDMIANHCGSQHWWMDDLPTDDWLNFQDSFRITNHRKTVPLDPYAAEEDVRMMFDGWFVRSMPDLNQRNPLMATYLIQNSIWWIEYAGLNGIRQDTYPYPDKDFMTDWTCRIMEEYPDFNIVGEVWDDNPVLVAYWQAGKVNSDGYTSCLPSLMDFPMQSTLSRSLQSERGWSSGLNGLYSLLANDVIYADPFNMVIFPDNHDMSRIYTQMDENADLTKMALTYINTMRGIPQIYYGTEIAMSNKGTDSHGVIRSDYPGGWAGDSSNAFTGENLTETQSEMQSFVTKLLNWRKDQTVVHHGKLKHFLPEDDVYVYFRYADDDVVMVAMNNGDEAQTVAVERFADVLGGRSMALNPISGAIVDASESVVVPAKTALILDFE